MISHDHWKCCSTTLSVPNFWSHQKCNGQSKQLSHSDFFVLWHYFPFSSDSELYLRSVNWRIVRKGNYFIPQTSTIALLVLLTDSGCFQPNVSSWEDGPGGLDVWGSGFVRWHFRLHCCRIPTTCVSIQTDKSVHLACSAPSGSYWKYLGSSPNVNAVKCETFGVREFCLVTVICPIFKSYGIGRARL